MFLSFGSLTVFCNICSGNSFFLWTVKFLTRSYLAESSHFWKACKDIQLKENLKWWFLYTCNGRERIVPFIVASILLEFRNLDGTWEGECSRLWYSEEKSASLYLLMPYLWLVKVIENNVLFGSPIRELRFRSVLDQQIFIDDCIFMSELLTGGVQLFLWLYFNVKLKLCLPCLETCFPISGMWSAA